MHPSSLLSYYPTYAILDEIVSYANYNKINIFVDLKNCLQTLYMEHAIVNIIENTLQARYVDTSVFSSVISFLSFHKLYSLKRNIEVNFYIFFERGQSYYHKNISSKYKISRRIDDLYGLPVEKREAFFKIMRKNLILIEKACNMMPNVNVIALNNLEADFVPYYLIRNKLVDCGPNVANVVYSNDHDLLQTIQLANNVYVYQRVPQYKKVIKKNEVMKRFLKVDKPFPDDYLDISMAVIGDGGDDVDGVRGIAQKTMSKILEEVVNLGGGIEKIRENVVRGKPIFDPNLPTNPNKYMSKVLFEEKNNKLISNNMKLVSFEILSRFVDDPISTEMVKKRKHIIEVLQNKKVAPLQVIRGALEKSRVLLEDNTLETIYYQK